MIIVPSDSVGIAQALKTLSEGHIIVHATETCYGLACDLGNPEAVRKLFAIKQRPSHQPLSALFPTVDHAKTYVVWNARADELAREFLPGPLTLILPKRPDAPTALCTSPDAPPQTLGVRVSPHPVALELVTRFGTPIATTSANVHGQENPYDVPTILAQYEKSGMKPDLILDSGTLERRSPSRIIDLSGTSEDILRS